MEVDIERSFPSKVLNVWAALSEKFLCPQEQFEFQNNAIKLWKTRILLHRVRILKDRNMVLSFHPKSSVSTSCVQLKLTKKHAVLVFWDEEIYESGLTDAMYQLVKVCEELILMINQNREKDDFVVVSRLLSGGHKHGWHASPSGQDHLRISTETYF